MTGCRLLPPFLMFAIAFTGLAHSAIPTAGQTPQGTASTPGYSSDSKEVDTAAMSCLFDPERGEVPDCLRHRTDGEVFVTRQILKELHFDSHGLAAVWSAREGWMYVGRNGRVVVSGVPTMDNWADSFHDGLVRVVRNNKYGFANRKGRVLISAIYDGAMNFEKGKAKVCNHCQSKCADHDGEHHVFAGGEWFQINAKGTVLARIPPDS